MFDIFSIINEAKSLISEGDRGQILLQTPNKAEGDRKGQAMGKNPDPTGVIKKGESRAKKLLRGSKKVQESRFEKAKGSKEGRSAIHSSRKKYNPEKSRVPIAKSITTAIRTKNAGQVFTTPKSDKFYVVTKGGKWGTDKHQIISGKTAKGFHGFKPAKRFAVRTLIRHGKSTDKRFKGKKYWKSKKS
jgi:hypothetical protein